MNNEHVFALDIGTRTVVGLLCRITDSGEATVEHYCVEYHPQRAMLDGQIHDVGQVSAVLARVRETLEEEAGHPLTRVAIAAAGRALSTLHTTAQVDFSSPQEITPDDLHHLEVSALGKAREEMAREKTSLYCVGFSPVSYTLNGMRIANPVGQRGKSMGIEIIATFLPQVVIDSLFSAVGKAGMAVDSLTLEPIAAMAVAVPPQLRLLNLALVDIGAGTSDIAVSRDGTIIAYGMVDMAGDEITEILAQHYLLDFNTAERIKVEMTERQQIEFVDVLGNKYSENKDALFRVIEPVVDKLAAALAEAVKDNNGGTAPAALFCAGGGSLTPMLKDYLALHLDLPQERIGIRTLENLEGINFISGDLNGPEVVTPLGIALTAIRPKGENFIQVWVNGQGVTLCNVQKITVAQALIHSGLDIDAVMGAGSASIEFALNGEAKKLAGQVGRPGSVWVNDAAATLDTELVSGDRVEASPGSKGEVPRVTLAQLAEDVEHVLVSVNDTVIDLPSMRMINGLPADQDAEIESGDRVEIRPPANVGELAAVMDLDLNQLDVKVDGADADSDTIFSSGSVITMNPRTDAKGSEYGEEVTVTVNGRSLVLSPHNALLMHALAQAEIDCTQARGSLTILANGRDADFTTPLKPGDKVEVFWTPGNRE